MPTLADIARAAGCSTYTVSCALRGLKSVAEPTRARIELIAREMDYRPDGAAALLALRRKRSHSDAGLIPVAALGVPSWELASSRGVWAGFREACHGHGLEPVPWKPEECAAPGLPRILWSRGVEGIFLFRQGIPHLQTREWNDGSWAKFHVVKEGRVGDGLAFDLVRHSAFDYMMETLRQVVRNGYRRVGVVLTRSLSAEDDLARTGAALAFQNEHLPKGGWLGIRTLTRGSLRSRRAEVQDWLRRHRAEAAVVFPFLWHSELLDLGMTIPGDIALAAPLLYDVPGQRGEIAGCDAAGHEYGTRAADLMFRLFRGGRRGCQAHPIEEVIEPEWVEGKSLPARSTRGRLTCRKNAPLVSR